jgi:hypothetical protein
MIVGRYSYEPIISPESCLQGEDRHALSPVFEKAHAHLSKVWRKPFIRCDARASGASAIADFGFSHEATDGCRVETQ